MKFAVDEHRTQLKHAEEHLAQEEARLARMQASVNLLREQVAFSRQQIKEAGRRGMGAFDAHRLLVKRAQ